MPAQEIKLLGILLVSELNMLILGKVLETIGSILLAFVGIQAALLEVLIGRHLVPKKIEDPQPETGTSDVASDVERVRRHLEEIHSLRRRQFGSREALAVGFGTTLIAIGCIFYLFGLLSEH